MLESLTNETLVLSLFKVDSRYYIPRASLVRLPTSTLRNASVVSWFTGQRVPYFGRQFHPTIPANFTIPFTCIQTTPTPERRHIPFKSGNSHPPSSFDALDHQTGAHADTRNVEDRRMSPKRPSGIALLLLCSGASASSLAKAVQTKLWEWLYYTLPYLTHNSALGNASCNSRQAAANPPPPCAFYRHHPIANAMPIYHAWHRATRHHLHNHLFVFCSSVVSAVHNKNEGCHHHLMLSPTPHHIPNAGECNVAR